MEIRSFVSVFFKHLNIEASEWERIIRSESIINLNASQFLNIAELKDKQMIYNMLRVYASKKFNSDEKGQEEGYRFNRDEKNKTLNTLYAIRDKNQFVYACETFCSLPSSEFVNYHNLIIEITSIVAQAKKDYQAKWGTIFAKNAFITRGNDTLDIMRFVTSLECESDMLSAYNEISKLQNEHLDDRQIELRIKKIMNKYKDEENTNIPKGMSDMFPLEEMDDYLEEDLPRIIRVKSINTLHRVSARRQKVER